MPVISDSRYRNDAPCSRLTSWLPAAPNSTAERILRIRSWGGDSTSNHLLSSRPAISSSTESRMAGENRSSITTWGNGVVLRYARRSSSIRVGKRIRSANKAENSAVMSRPMRIRNLGGDTWTRFLQYEPYRTAPAHAAQAPARVNDERAIASATSTRTIPCRLIEFDRRLAVGNDVSLLPGLRQADELTQGLHARTQKAARTVAPVATDHVRPSKPQQRLGRDQQERRPIGVVFQNRLRFDVGVGAVRLEHSRKRRISPM